MQSLHLQQTIREDGKLQISNLPLVRGQQVQVVLLFAPVTTAKKRLTARRLLDSGLMGLWKERTDIADGAEYARQLRERAQRRAR